MTDLIALALLVLGVLLTLSASFLVLPALFPALLADVQHMVQTKPRRSLAVGFVNLLFAAVLALSLAGLAENLELDLLGVPFLMVVALVGFGLFLGLAGVAQVVGQRLGPEWSPTRRSLGGGLALTLAVLTPGVGWLGLLPYVLLLGFGALILALWARRTQG